jgi:two-component system, cell cycle sensor histidine kinase and response regulator CckA
VVTDARGRWPTLGGKDAFRARRRMRPDVRAVLMSEYSSHDLAARCGAEGLAGFMQKPFRVEELEPRLTTVFGSASGRPDDRQPDGTCH